MTLEEIRALVRADLVAVDDVVRASLKSTVPLVDQVAEHIISGGGKRLRPLLVVLAGRACGAGGRRHTEAAAFIEFIHTATLLHDDVVDASELRRGKETANAVWGNEASVLVGDFLYSRAFEMMVTVKSMRVMEIMARATNVIAEGEVMQLLSSNDADTTEERYLEVIRCKTAKLFEAAAQVGAIVSGASAAEEEAMAAYGRHLGTAFQLIDDVLDYSGSSQHIGKNVGDDLAAGKPTLPLIHALRRGNPQEAAIIRNAIVHGGREKIAEVLKAIESTEALAYTARSARDEAAKAAAALAVLPASPYREAMYALAEFSVNRSY